MHRKHCYANIDGVDSGQRSVDRPDRRSGGKVDPGSQVGINPIQDIADKTIANLAPDLTMVIPVFALGIQYATTFETVGKAVKGEPTRDLDYAKKYAENMRELVRNAVFTNYLNALITANVAKGAPVPKDRMDHLLPSINIFLKPMTVSEFLPLNN